MILQPPTLGSLWALVGKPVNVRKDCSSGVVASHEGPCHEGIWTATIPRQRHHL